MRIRYGAAVAWMLAAATVCGTTAAIAAARTGKARALPIVIRFVPPATCEISVSNQLYSVPIDQDRMATALRQLRREWKSAHIVGGPEIPYRCVGYAIFIAQSSGFNKVGFIAEPPK